MSSSRAVLRGSGGSADLVRDVAFEMKPAGHDVCVIAEGEARMKRRPARWTGAGLIPARGFGYWSATMPLVLLQLDDSDVTVRVRPDLLGRLTGAKVLTATPADGTELFLVRSRGVLQGVEFRPPRRSSFYFYTRHRDEVLAALTKAGFVVSAQPGRERPIWHQPDDD